jgi:hypothetical protein
MFITAFLLHLAAAPAEAAPQVSSALEDTSNSTPKEMTEGAAEMLGEIDGAVVTVKKLLEVAKSHKKKDDELVKCLTAKVPQLTTIQELAGKANTSMKSRLASGNEKLARSEYRQVSVLYKAAMEGLVAAHACVKSVAGEPGKSTSSISGGDQFTVEDVETEIPVDAGLETTAH